MSRELPKGYTLKQIRVVKKASGYFVMLCYQLAVDVPNSMFSGHPLGVDIGLLIRQFGTWYECKILYQYQSPFA